LKGKAHIVARPLAFSESIALPKSSYVKSRVNNWHVYLTEVRMPSRHAGASQLVTHATLSQAQLSVALDVVLNEEFKA